jgi:TolB protein
LTNDPGWDATQEWPPDGKVIAFASLRAGRRDIYTIHPDGTGHTRLTTGEATPPTESPFLSPAP